MRAPKTIVVDLDYTLCIPKEGWGEDVRKYEFAMPITDRIRALNRCFLAGDHIIIFTARRMRTHKGNVEAVEAEVGQLTRDWLKTYNVFYHELKFGKPNADIYIDDKAGDPSRLFELAYENREA